MATRRKRTAKWLCRRINTAAAKSLQLCLTLCDPTDSSPPGPPRPWDSPGKSTGGGCHCLLWTVKLEQREIAISKAYKSQAGSVGKGKGTSEAGGEMNYIQETASSSLCLSIKRNKTGLDHDKRPHVQPLKIWTWSWICMAAVGNWVLRNKKAELEEGSTGQEVG